jgi:acyl-CoA thioester hydrolase
MERDGLQLPVIESHCEYRQPAKYDDELEVRTTGAVVSPVRIKFSYELVRPSDNATLAIGHTIHAALDAAGRPRRLPESVRTLMEREPPDGRRS